MLSGSYCWRVSAALILVCSLGLISGCGRDPEQTLAPYEDFRPLIWQKLTQSLTPDLQWLGGRVAAIGVNKGRQAALDSSLVWLRVAPDNTIGSYVTVDTFTATDIIQNLGGTAVDSLTDSTAYTFWLADLEAYQSGLDTLTMTRHNLLDTTITISLKLPGRVGGQTGLLSSLTIVWDRHLTREKIKISWTPDSVAFRQMVIRKGNAGGYTERIYHIMTADTTDSILPPVVIGQEQAGWVQAKAWSLWSFNPGKRYFLWMSNTSWEEENFNPRAQGYAWFMLQKIPNN